MLLLILIVEVIIQALNNILTWLLLCTVYARKIHYLNRTDLTFAIMYFQNRSKNGKKDCVNPRDSGGGCTLVLKSNVMKEKRESSFS